MKTQHRLGGYGLGLSAVFAGALAVGSAVGPISAANTHPSQTASHQAGQHGQKDMGAMPAMNHQTTSKDPMPSMGAGGQGLGVSAGGYTLSTGTNMLPTGESATFTFRILAPTGEPLTVFTREHDKELHLIVVRQDLTGYQHLHPTMAPDGTWSVPLRLSSGGAYKAFSDFRPVGQAMAMTLAVDLFAAGPFTPVPLPPPATTATVDGYQVHPQGEVVAGRESDLSLTVTKDGRPVSDLQPHLAAYGHLVALRVGDLAYLHVHPDGAPGDGRTPAGPQIVFHADVPTPGAYRLFLDFKHGDVVRTAEFTVVAAKEKP